MSKSEKALFGNSWTGEIVTQGPALILEKYLSATLQLCWRVQQERIRSGGATPTKTRLLFDGLAGELQSFIASIQKRLKLWTRKKPAVTELDQSSYWRLFPVDSYDLRDQLEVLLCGYAHYARQTSEACTKLQQAGDPRSSELLATISKRIDRCLWFLEIHLEGLALRMDDNRLPAWPEGKYAP